MSIALLIWLLACSLAFWLLASLSRICLSTAGSMTRPWVPASVLAASNSPIHAVRCTPGQSIGCRGDRSRCLTHDLWEELSNQIHLYLSSVSLGDVCARRVLGTSGLAQRKAYREVPEASAQAAE